MILRRTALRAFSAALHAFPREHRDRYRAEMLDTFADAFAARVRERGGAAALAFMAAALLDALRAGFGERARQRRSARASGFTSHPRERRDRGASLMGMSWLDVKLGFRMLRRYPGLTVASGLALAIAIGVGAGWYDLTGDLLRPRLPIPDGDRLVEIELRNAAASEEERRVLHDFVGWRRDLRSIEDLSAYRTVERNLIVERSRPEPVRIAEITASGLAATRVPPILGRPLAADDEHPSAPAVVVLGYAVWQQRFGGRTDAIGTAIGPGRTQATVVGVMPDGYGFPVNHQAWMPLRIDPAGYAPLEGTPIRVFGRLAAGATQAQANSEVSALVDRTRADSPRTHEHLTPRVLAYGGESPGDRGILEFVVRHLPVLLVLLVACANVGTLIYARTATREAEIATRYALGASRGRIVGQLFAEALILAAVAAAIGLLGANWALKWGVTAYYSGADAAMPFWVNPGLKPLTVIFAALLTIIGAAILGVLPALRATRRSVQAEIRNSGTARTTLRFGWVWTTAMIAQVALTVMCLPPAYGISEEAIRDRAVRQAFPAEEYLAVRIALDREGAPSGGDGSLETHARRVERVYEELARRVAQEPGVRTITFGDRLPGMGVAVQRAEVEIDPGESPRLIHSLWTAAVGPGYFEAFDVPLLAGRSFHEADRRPGATAVLVNEAFARRYFNGESPVGRRVRFESTDPAKPEPWSEIVGMVRDVGMTPTDLGEAPYLYRAATPATAFPLVMGIRLSTDPAVLAPRLRAIAADIEPALRLEEVRSLGDLVWRIDVPMMVGAGAIVFVVALGLFLSAAGIFALMSVSVARRTREIGLRAALGATQGRLLAGIFSRALALIGSGVAAGNVLLVLFVALEPEVELQQVWGALIMTSAVMLSVGLLACAEPARRALRIQPTDALRDAG